MRKGVSKFLRLEVEGDVKVLRVLRIYPQKPSHFEARMRARLLRFFEGFSKILKK